MYIYIYIIYIYIIYIYVCIYSFVYLYNSISTWQRRVTRLAFKNKVLLGIEQPFYEHKKVSDSSSPDPPRCQSCYLFLPHLAIKLERCYDQLMEHYSSQN